MGEMPDTYMSDQEKAIERIVERRFKRQREALSTDAIDQNLKDKIRREVEDEYLLLCGRIG